MVLEDIQTKTFFVNRVRLAEPRGKDMLKIKDYKNVVSVYEYDGNGKFFHKVNKGKGRVGERAGHLGNRGYRVLTLNKKTYLDHRVIFFIHNGFLPEVIDHINNDPLDNRIENLRACSVEENCWNAMLSKSNNSGFKGVGWHSASKKWRARLKMRGEEIHIGMFDDLNEAVKAVRKKRESLHGQFCNHGVIL